MSVYLRDIPLIEAQNRFAEALKEAGYGSRLEAELITLDENALDRILAEPIWAKQSSPHYHAAAMDGFAVTAAETFPASETKPIILICGKQAVYLDTGDPLPGWANAVIPIENIEALDENNELSIDKRKPYAIRIRSAVPPWRYVRPLGEDIVASQLVMPAGHRIRAVDIGVMAACGHSQVQVVRRPKVAILPTGSELVPVGIAPKIGEIIEFNSLMLAAQINSWLGIATRYDIIPDDFERICQVVRQASLEHDLILLNAGSSAGSEDFSAKVVESLGELLVHGVAVRPGHPVILGMIHRSSTRSSVKRNKVPIIGVPGYPVSAALTGEIFIRPLIYRWLGITEPEPHLVKAFITKKITSPPGDDDYIRVAVGKVGDRVLAAPLSRGAGVITSLAQADGILILPRGSQGLSSGEEVSIRLYRPISILDQTILVIGSHDMTLDLMTEYLAKHDRRLTSSNVGSLGGLLALKRREAHLAGSHLLDEESGEYNIPYIRHYLPGIPVIVITLVGRQQGLIVVKGNPLEIKNLNDLIRTEVTFINRQKGAGTRQLLDFNLKKQKINPQEIKGYDHEEYTHLSVAAAVSSGRGSCGLGIAAAAAALDLDFIPLFHERYDIVIPQEHYQSKLLTPLIELLKDKMFRKAVSQLPGYDVTPMGKIVAIID